MKILKTWKNTGMVLFPEVPTVGYQAEVKRSTTSLLISKEVAGINSGGQIGFAEILTDILPAAETYKDV